MRFLYAPRMEEFILKTIRERWRGHKAKLKEKYFDVNKSKEANCNNVPADVLPDQWIALINHWMNGKSKVYRHCIFTTVMFLQMRLSIELNNVVLMHIC